MRVVRQEGLPRSLARRPPPAWAGPIDHSVRVGARVREDVARVLAECGVPAGDPALSALEPYELAFSADAPGDAAAVTAVYARRDVDFFRFDGSAWLVSLWLPRAGDRDTVYAEFLGYVRDVCAAAREDLGGTGVAWVYTRERRTAEGVCVHVVVSLETTALCARAP